MLAAFCFTVEGGRIADARVAFGGMAGIPKRAKAVEESLRGLSLADTSRWHLAAEAIAKDFTPLTDLRASAAYRSRVAGNLVVKAIAEMAGINSSVTRVARSPDRRRCRRVMPSSRRRCATSTSRCRTTAAPSTCRALPNISTTFRSRRARCISPSAARRWRAAIIRRIDLDEVQNAPGVVAVITAADIPGKNDISPASADEPVFVQDRVDFHNQPVFAVVATSRDAARRAVLRGKIEVDAEKPNVTVEQGRASGEVVLPDYAFINGDAAGAIAESPRRSTGKICISAARSIFIWKVRSRWPFPAKTAPCWSIRRPSIRAKCSTSLPACSRVPDSFVTCRVRRMGGGFGGKETQATQWAVIAALAARVTGRACKFRLDRDADMAMTGKRHDFAVEYAVGYDADGRIRAVDLDLDARCGCSADCQHRRGRSRHVPLRQHIFPAGIANPYARASRPTQCRTPRFAVSAARRA